MYVFSDAWFLTTLLLAKDWSPLPCLMAAGDWLNHAIFTAREINRAVSLLTSAGYVELNGHKEMRATPKALSLCNASFERAGALRKVELVLAKLQKEPLTAIKVPEEWFSEQETRLAYEIYIETIRSSRKYPPDANACLPTSGDPSDKN